MGKEIVVDGLVRDAFIFENETSTVGLLIGTYNETGEYCVAHLAETLEEAEVEPHVEVEDPNSTAVPDKQRLSSKSFTEIKMATISHHAKQVIRMLPGGLVVLGLYIVEPVDNIFTTKYEGSMRELLTTMNKSLLRNAHVGADFGKNNEKIVIHYHPETKKFTVKVVDCVTFKSQKMETTFARIEWEKLECEYDTFYAMHLAKADIGFPLTKNMKVLMDTFQETLDSAKFIVNGNSPSKSEIYVQQVAKPVEPGMSDTEDDVHGDTSGSNSGGSGNSSPRKQIIECAGDSEGSESDYPENLPPSPIHILIQKTPGSVKTSPGQDFVSHLHLHGKIAVVAFVRSGCSTAFLVEMLKQDILRSLASRIEMHCESLIEEEQGTQQTQLEEGPTKVYHEVPRRVFANLLGSKLLVSDYLFPGEGPKDSLVSFRDILSLQLADEEGIIMTKEKPFNLDELRSKGSLEELICKVEPVASDIKRSNFLGIACGVAMIVLIIGMLIQYSMYP